MSRIRLVFGASLLALCAVMNTSVKTASAQERNVVAPTAVERDDDGFDASWLGLLGLLGLAGLAGRNRSHTRSVTTREDAAAHR